MKRIFRTVGLLLLCGALLAPVADAQTRGRNNNTSQQKASPAQTRPSATSVQRPGNSGQAGNTGSQSSRPGTPSGNGSQPGNSNGRPGSQIGNTTQRPPNPPSNNGNGRPGTTPPGSVNRPGTPPPGGPVGGPQSNYRPTPPPPGRPGMGPARPGMPPMPHTWYRPTPPPAWRPPSGWRPFRSILGISLGTAINISINSLINNGYVVSHYGDNSVYVQNVPMLNMMWPNAILYYNNVGGLCGSRFIYGSAIQDMTRYNSTYATLVATYGSPYSIQNTASGLEATWWGTGNQFITLSYAPEYTPSGTVAFYTTLAFGN